MKHAFIGAVAGILFASSALATEIETKSLEELYAEAVAEGGELVIRAGGDKDDQADYYLDMFKERFPETKGMHVFASANIDDRRGAFGVDVIAQVLQANAGLLGDGPEIRQVLGFRLDDFQSLDDRRRGGRRHGRRENQRP